MSTSLTSKIKSHVLDLGADLVGIANIERFKNAPIMMSPQGIMPTAKCVVVCAIHHPDSTIQLDGEKHPQIMNSYYVQMVMNMKLDVISFKLANHLESLGYDAVPIASSNIWRYRNFMNLEANFAPDMSHIYAATAAGLGQVGWNGLTSSPEYGAWNRFVSVITDAPLDATPLYTESKLCDMCGECIRHCRTDAFRKEVQGTNVLEIEDCQFKFARKNLWRCAWGEHFGLDLDLQIPDVVDEKVILDNIRKHGRRGGEMGSCLKYCLPPQLRIKDESYTSTYIRKRPVVATDLPAHRALMDRIVEAAAKYAADSVAFLDYKQCEAGGLAPDQFFKDAKTAVVLQLSVELPDGNLTSDKLLGAHGGKAGDKLTPPYKGGVSNLKWFAALDIARLLEGSGYGVFIENNARESDYAALAGFKPAANGITQPFVIFTTAVFAGRTFNGLQQPADNPKKSLTGNLADQLESLGIDLYGVAPAAKIAALSEALKPYREGEEVLLAYDKDDLFRPYNPEVTAVKRALYTPQDYLKTARNVLVIGEHFPSHVTRRALKPPAYAVGPYVFAEYEASNELNYDAIRLCVYLQHKGYRAVFTHDLIGVGSDIGSPRGLLSDALCNSFEAAAAGIGQVAYNGALYTERFGLNQRFIAIVTDAPLEALCSEKPSGDVSARCEGCRQCAAACPGRAISSGSPVTVEVEGQRFTWLPADAKRCDWCKKYALNPDDGNYYTGANTNVPMPEKIDEQALSEALKQSDEILKFRPCTAESCILNCPLTK